MIEGDRVMATALVEAQANKKFHEAMEEADKIGFKSKIDPDDKKTAAAGEG
jgi:hypothetical protein